MAARHPYRVDGARRTHGSETLGKSTCHHRALFNEKEAVTQPRNFLVFGIKGISMRYIYTTHLGLSQLALLSCSKSRKHVRAVVLGKVLAKQEGTSLF
jgi:hypothetical protein